jgi:hypothetical protein
MSSTVIYAVQHLLGSAPVNLLSNFTTSSLLSHKKYSCSLTESIALIPLYPEGE